MDTLDRISALSADKTLATMRLGEAVNAINDLARICEAVRLSAGLGKGQWERVIKARAVAAKCEFALSALASVEPHTEEVGA